MPDLDDLIGRELQGHYDGEGGKRYLVFEDGYFIQLEEGSYRVGNHYEDAKALFQPLLEDNKT